MWADRATTERTAAAAEGVQTATTAQMAADTMPAWVKDVDFLTEPLEGNKANFILQNSQRLRAYFEGKAGKVGQLFAIYDRHPPDTALDPQSGVLYFIRTEEGLQVILNRLPGQHCCCALLCFVCAHVIVVLFLLSQRRNRMTNS